MSDIDAFQEDLRNFLKSFGEKIVRPTLENASNRIGARAIDTYMQRGRGQPRTRVHKGPLRIVSGRLSESLRGTVATRGGRVTTSRGRIDDTGGSGEAINDIQVAKGKGRLTKGSKVPYARIHEKGGMIKITRKMRGFFWAKFAETNEGRWKAMALTKQSHINIPARPYLEPALEDEIDGIVKYLTEKFEEAFPA